VLRRGSAVRPDVRFGSGTDISARSINVRYSPKSRHSSIASPSSAWCQKRTLAQLLDHLVGGGKQR